MPQTMFRRIITQGKVKQTKFYILIQDGYVRQMNRNGDENFVVSKKLRINNVI